MKKIGMVAGFGLFACLAFVACDQYRLAEKDLTNAVEDAQMQMSEPAGSFDEPMGRTASPELGPSTAGMMLNDQDTRCNPSGGGDQCALIPAGPDNCLGCMVGKQQVAVNIDAAKRIMGGKRTQCEAKVKSFFEKMKGQKGPMPKMSRHESCKHNWATCSSQGFCVGQKLSREELERRMPKSTQGQQSGGMGQGQPPSGGSGFGAPQDQPGGGGYPGSGYQPQQPQDGYGGGYQ